MAKAQPNPTQHRSAIDNSIVISFSTTNGGMEGSINQRRCCSITFFLSLIAFPRQSSLRPLIDRLRLQELRYPTKRPSFRDAPLSRTRNTNPNEQHAFPIQLPRLSSLGELLVLLPRGPRLVPPYHVTTQCTACHGTRCCHY